MGLEERARREKPHVKVYLAPGGAADLCREAGFGLEEEGIPGVVGSVSLPGGAVELAFTAAQASPLETGIGVAADGMAVHFSRLPKERPLFFATASECSRSRARELGANAARLVKGVPFKEHVRASPPTGPPAAWPAGAGPSEDLVLSVVRRVLAEMENAWGGEHVGTTGPRAG